MDASSFPTFLLNFLLFLFPHSDTQREGELLETDYKTGGLKK